MEDTFDQTSLFIKDFMDQKARFNRETFGKTLGKLLQRVPLKLINSIYPLDLSAVDARDVNYEDKTNAWIIYILRRYVKKVELEDYLFYLLPQLQFCLHQNPSFNQSGA